MNTFLAVKLYFLALNLFLYIDEVNPVLDLIIIAMIRMEIYIDMKL